MDAFSVSLVHGLRTPDMNAGRRFRIAGIFALFQFLMPVLGWGLVHTIVTAFRAFERFIPWIALLLLVYIGGKMLLEGIRGETESEMSSNLLMQAVATSIDALSVGFTIAEYTALQAVSAAVIIAVVTFAVCTAGVEIGKKIGTRLSGKASILGGVILIFIGLEIFIRGILS